MATLSLSAVYQRRHLEGRSKEGSWTPKDLRFLRARASIALAIARISYGNSVCPSVCLFVCPFVTTRYRFEPMWDRNFGFSRWW